MDDADESRNAVRPAAGLLGTFDLANFGDLILPAVAERELTRRVPDLRVRRYSPFGWEHPVPMDGGDLAEPLGVPTVARRREIAGDCDAVVIGGGEIAHFADHLLAPHYDTTVDDVMARAPSTWFFDGLGAAAERPTVWNAVGVPFDIDEDRTDLVRAALGGHRYVAVRDQESRKRLEQVGIDREIAVVPDPGFLVSRLFDGGLVERRRRLHAALGWSPPGRYIVVQGNGSMLGEVDRTSMAIEAVLAQRPDIGIVALDTGLGHGDSEFRSAFVARHPARVWAPDAPLLPVDVVAIIAGAEAFVGVSLHGAITALAHGRRAVVFNAPRQSKHRGLMSHLDDQDGYTESADDLPRALRWALAALGPDHALAGIERQIDAHFDRIAEIVEAAAAAPGRDPRGDRTARRIERLSGELTALRTAHGVRGTRLLAERDALTQLLDQGDMVARDLEAQLATASARVAALESTVANADALAAQVEALTAEHGAYVAAAEARLATAQAERDAAAALHHAAERALSDAREAHDAVAAELRALYATRTLRWLRLPRRVYGRLRR